VAEQGPPGRSGDDLVAVERQHPGGAERAGRAAAKAGAERLGGILHHGYAVLVTEAEDGVIIGAPAVEVDGDDGRGQRLAGSAALGQLGGQQDR
jgi:hypothetical protein